MSRSRSFARVAALVAGATVGCAPPSEEVKHDAPQAPMISLSDVDRAAYDDFIDKHRGQAVLVDFWATWCAPCLKQLPHTLELARRHQGDGLVVVTMSMDEADARPQVVKVLADRDAGEDVTHLMSVHGGGSHAMEAFEIGSGALPHYKLYDRTGKLRRTFELDPLAEKQFTMEDIDATVAELLAEHAD